MKQSESAAPEKAPYRAGCSEREAMVPPQGRPCSVIKIVKAWDRRLPNPGTRFHTAGDPAGEILWRS